jgi:hypothetical protein
LFKGRLEPGGFIMAGRSWWSREGLNLAFGPVLLPILTIAATDVFKR